MKKETYCELCGAKTKFGGKTCSRKCAGELERINNREKRNCKVCMSEFDVKKTSKKTMCSDKCRIEWGSRPENIKSRISLAEDAVFQKHGIKSTLQLESVKEKIKDTKTEKYGDANFVNPKKAKNTKKEKYGDENYNNHKQSNETKLLKYGDENYNNRDKAIKTMTELYGVSYAIQRRDFFEKAMATNVLRYGVSNPRQNAIVNQKAEQTCIERYGARSPSQNEDVKIKMKNTFYAKFPDTLIFEKMKINSVKIIGEYTGMSNDGKYNKYTFECLICDSHFSGTFSNNRPPICRTCFPISENSKHNLELKNFLLNLSVQFQDNTKSIIPPYELDFYFEDYNLAIEINGNYYHSEIGGDKNRKYHINKSNLCNEKGIKLIHIFEDEWIFGKEIVKSKIKNWLGLTPIKIYARKCNIINVDEVAKINFLELNHIQRNSKDSIRLGLTINNELVSVMTFIKLRKSLGNTERRDDFWELVRFCSKVDTNVIGGFNKLLNAFVKKYNPGKIVTYADCRWSGINYTDTVYHKRGFLFSQINQPRYWYFEKNDYLKRYHRFKFTKKKLLKLYGQNIDMHEWQIAQLLKMDRIWDCGTMRFELDLKQKRGNNPL